MHTAPTIDFLREDEAGDDSGTDAEKSPIEQLEDEERFAEQEEINCVNCGERITRPQFRTQMSGKHEHACVNPAGILFEIGCFSQVEGCQQVGPESDEFTWFEGYTWQISICNGCGTHLGWRFWSPDHVFWGLILNRLV